MLAVDPSSPFTGGAILGDRVRMQDHATDPASTSGRCPAAGHLGGLSAATPQAVRVLEGAGCDVVLVETVGVGQAEVEVARWPTPRWCCSRPGMGDAIQAVKAGMLEIADVFVVNKADRDGADATYRDIQGMIALGERGAGRLAAAGGARGRGRARRGHRRRARPRSTSTGPGWTSTASCAAAGSARAAAEVEAIALGTLRARIGSLRHGTALPDLAGRGRRRRSSTRTPPPTACSPRSPPPRLTRSLSPSPSALAR